MKLLSIIIPVYNTFNYLEKCVRSVMEQTYTDLEIILVDDGSTDRSPKMCDDFAKEDSRVRVIHKENGGLSSARNAALEIVTGEYVAFVDSDDWLEKNTYKEMIGVLEERSTDIIASAFYKCQDGEKEPMGNTNKISEWTSEDIFLNILKVNFVTWNKIYKRSVIAKTRFVLGQVYEDLHFNGEIFLRVKKMIYIDKPYYNYRLSRPGNTNSRFNPGRLCVFKEFDTIIKNLQLAGYERAEKEMTMYAIEFYKRLYKEAWELKAGKETRKTIRAHYMRTYQQAAANGIRLKGRMRRFYINADVEIFYEFFRAKVRIIIKGK